MRRSTPITAHPLIKHNSAAAPQRPVGVDFPPNPCDLQAAGPSTPFPSPLGSFFQVAPRDRQPRNICTIMHNGAHRPVSKNVGLNLIHIPSYGTPKNNEMNILRMNKTAPKRLKSYLPAHPASHPGPTPNWLRSAKCAPAPLSCHPSNNPRVQCNIEGRKSSPK